MKKIEPNIFPFKDIQEVGIVVCSNAQLCAYQPQNQSLIEFLHSNHIEVSVSDFIYSDQSDQSGTAEERANALMDMYRNPKISEIYDISGGDLANQILDYLNYELIKNSPATFWGYSDLTTVINAIYSLSGKKSVLYQVKHMTFGKDVDLQRYRFLHRDELFQLNYRFVQGNSMEGIVVGGNIRCFLKLAGTRYFPDLSGKLLLLEAFGSTGPQLHTFLAQLKQLGAFEKVGGIILGTFTKYEETNNHIPVEELVKEYAPNLPIIKTDEIGHYSNAKAIIIGSNYHFAQ